MAEYGVIDAAIIHTKPDIIFNALVTEFSSETKWCAPYFEAKPRGKGAIDQPGALIDITIKGRFPIKFTAKTVEIKKDELFRVDYIEG